MLLTRDEICRDPNFEALTDAILEHDQPRTTDLFFKMVARHGHSVGEALSVVTAAEAPFRAGAQPHQRARRPDHADQQ